MGENSTHFEPTPNPSFHRILRIKPRKAGEIKCYATKVRGQFMKGIFASTLGFLMFFSTNAVLADGSFTCGLKPLPELGCRIGRCVDGAWERICDSAPTLSCGLKPLPNLGCRIGRCVDGYWEQICDSAPSLSCGLKPLPNLGCRIGRCVDGHWEQICN